MWEAHARPIWEQEIILDFAIIDSEVREASQNPFFADTEVERQIRRMITLDYED